MATVTLIEKDGQIFLPLPDEVMSEMALTEGDTLEFRNNGDSVVIEKQKLYMVTTKVVFEISNLVYATSAEAAVAKLQADNDPPEFNQVVVGENIESAKEISKTEVTAMAKDICSTWDEQYVFDVLTIGKGETVERAVD